MRSQWPVRTSVCRSIEESAHSIEALAGWRPTLLSGVDEQLTVRIERVTSSGPKVDIFSREFILISCGFVVEATRPVWLGSTRGRASRSC